MAVATAAKKTQNILSRYDRSLEILFASDRLHRSRLSYFFACIDFAAAGAEINAEQLALRKRKSGVHHGCIKKHLRGLPARSKEIQMGQKLNSPHEWLLEKARHWNAAALYQALSDLACRLDGNSIQDLFQSAMNADGYFEQKVKSSPQTSPQTYDAESWGSHRWHT